ncbi:MAG: BatA domain-containing protein, partial [Roseibacillus sp.]|nr:BatA domain-containing protein [Roseibacillus sp.]
MNIVLTNPAGFFALLGIPALILIHFLQRQARVIPISTLFLLAHTQRESLSGRRFDRFTNSIPLWLQLLMVLLLTWLLVLPRYVRPASTQQVAVVLDSSASMSVFKDKLVSSLREKLPPLQGSASRLQLYLFESAAEKPVIYAGNDLEEALTTLEDWNPSAGSIDPDNSLRLARSRVNREGILIYVSDAPGADLPFNAQSLSIGEPRINVGFTGVAFENESDTIRWNALLRNYSDSPQTRSWQIVFADGSRSQPQPVTLEKNSMTTISSAFPAGSNSLRVVLTPDDFSLDDELPLVLPRPKSLKYYLQVSEKHGNIARKFGRFRNLEEVSDPIQADLSLVSYDPLLPALPG